MYSHAEMLGEISAAWRVAVAMASFMLLGAALLLLVEWPAGVAVVPDAPIVAARFWIGAALASPVGVLLGVVWQHAAAEQLPRTFTIFCAAGSVAMFVVALAMVAL
jgi:hypothetical protein